MFGKVDELQDSHGSGVGTPDGATAYDDGTAETPADDWWAELLRRVAAGEAQIVIRPVDGGEPAVLVGRRWLEVLEQAAVDQSPNPVRLSRRETEALDLAAARLTAAQTARRLGLAVNTVNQHLAAARRKFAVTSTAEAIALARRDGLIPLGPDSDGPATCR